MVTSTLPSGNGTPITSFCRTNLEIRGILGQGPGGLLRCVPTVHALQRGRLQAAQPQAALSPRKLLNASTRRVRGHAKSLTGRDARSLTFAGLSPCTDPTRGCRV